MTATSDLQEKLQQWRQDPVAFASDCRMRRPDGTVGNIILSDRQARAVEALGERDDDGAPKWKTLGLVWPKRSGKSLLAAIALLWKSLWPGRTSVSLANSREQAQSTIFDMTREIIKHTPELRDAAEVLRNEIQFVWGSEIRTVPCNRRTVAGIGVTGALASDELWQADDPEAFYLLAAQAEADDAQVLMVSQASGRLSPVHELYQTAQEGSDPRLWFDYLHPYELRRGGAAANPNPYISQEFIDSQKARLPGPLYRQYWLNEWGQAAAALLDPDDVEKVFEWQPPGDSVEALADGMPESYADGPWPQTEAFRIWKLDNRLNLGAGLDRALPGSGRDDSVWTLVGRTQPRDPDEDPHFYVLWQTLLETGAEGEVVAEHKVCTDVFGRFPTNLESYQSADLMNRVENADLVTPSAPKQNEIFGRLCRAVNEGRLHAPASMEKLKRQLLNFQVDTSGTQPKYGTPGTAVDDCVYSLSWGLDATDGPRAPTRRTAKKPRKTARWGRRR